MATKSRSTSRTSGTKRGSTTPAGGRGAAGWAALAQGRWDAAKSAFADALAHDESPEALEGLSWAAWWLDDADTVFDARERAWRLYRKRGDVAGAARMATWLAVDHLDFHGAFAVANGWLQRARRWLQTVEPRPDHGWLTFHEGYIASTHGDTARSLERARQATKLARRFDAPDLEMLGLALEGAVLVACARVQEGMRRLDEATAAALERETDIPMSRAWACCFLVTACEAVRDSSARSNGATASPSSSTGTGAGTCSGSVGSTTRPSNPRQPATSSVHLAATPSVTIANCFSLNDSPREKRALGHLTRGSCCTLAE